jgi:hypothetical protein
MTKKAIANVPSEGALENNQTQSSEARPRLQSVTAENGVLQLSGTKAEHEWIDQAFGSVSPDFQGYCLSQLVNIMPEKGSTDYTIAMNAALAMLSAINPQDELEAMLAVQMVASNHLALMSTRRATHTDLIASRQLNGNLATKFSRTFVAQLEALGKHRRGGKQIVEHVHVNEGGQAVIANTVNTGRGA